MTTEANGSARYLEDNQPIDYENWDWSKMPADQQGAIDISSAVPRRQDEDEKSYLQRFNEAFDITKLVGKGTPVTGSLGGDMLAAVPASTLGLAARGMRVQPYTTSRGLDSTRVWSNNQFASPNNVNTAAHPASANFPTAAGVAYTSHLTKAIAEQPGGEGLGEALTAFDDHIAVALHTVHEFFKGGLYQVAKDKKVELPDWTHKAAAIFNNPDFNEAMGATNIGAFLTYAKASGLNSNKMLKAMAMKDAGASEDQIFQKLGAEFYEGKWGERVPYSGMELKINPTKVDGWQVDANGVEKYIGKVDQYPISGNPRPLSKIMKHDDLFKADPSLKDIPVRSMTHWEVLHNPGTHGFVNREGTEIAIHPGLNKDQFQRALVHEVEHVVQSKHGLPGGSSEEVFRDASYRALETKRDEHVTNMQESLKRLADKGITTKLPNAQTFEDAADIAMKAKYTPSHLTADEKAIYKDILKYGFTKDLESLAITKNKLSIKDSENYDKYKRTKGEVGARVGEQELDVTKDEIKDISYKRFMEAEVPEHLRVDNPLDGPSNSIHKFPDRQGAIKAEQEAKEATKQAAIAEEKRIQDYREAKRALPQNERIAQTAVEQIIDENMLRSEHRIQPSDKDIADLVQAHRKKFIDFNGQNYTKLSEDLKLDLKRLENKANIGNPNLQINPSAYEDAQLERSLREFAQELNKRAQRERFSVIDGDKAK